jgi:HEAT repeat protein
VIIAALGDLRAASMGGAILREIKSRVPVVRHAAIVAIARLNPPGSVKALAAALGKVDPNEKAMVAAALGQTRSPGALQPLLSALKHPHPRVQMTVVQALAQLGQKGVYEALEKFAGQKKLSPPVKIALLKAYGLLGDKRATTWVGRALSDGNEKVKKNALKALGSLRDPKAVPAILPLLKEDAWVLEAVSVLGLTGSADALPGLLRIIRGESASAELLEKTFWAIGETRAASVVGTLTPFLKDARTNVAAWAAGALGRIGDKKAARALFVALKSDDKNLKSMAVWALEKLSGKRFGTEPSRWEDWVNEQR